MSPDLTTAVEAAARAWFEHQQNQRRDAGRHQADGQPWRWEDLPPIDQSAARALVLPIVTAALHATRVSP